MLCQEGETHEKHEKMVDVLVCISAACVLVVVTQGTTIHESE